MFIRLMTLFHHCISKHVNVKTGTKRNNKRMSTSQKPAVDFSGIPWISNTCEHWNTALFLACVVLVLSKVKHQPFITAKAFSFTMPLL